MAGYTRQDTQNNISNGSVIDADDLDAEFNAVEAGFNSTTGHSHDGTAGEGAPITKVGPAQDLIVSTGALTPKTTNTLDLGTNSIQFKNAWFDGTVDTDALTVSGNATVGGTLGVTGAITASAGVTGNLTGNVTGNVTGNLTGNVTGTVSDVSNHDTGDIAEGSNLYFTNERVDDRVAALVVAGTNISATYNDTAGTLTLNADSTGGYDLSNNDTGDLAEGSNLYYTNTRARAAVSATDAGGDGSFSYNSGTGVFTYTGPSATEVRSHFSAGTGVTYSSGQFSIGQAVGTGSNVTFNNVTASGAFSGNVTGNLTGNVAGNLTGNVAGNLTGNVTGNATTATTLATARTIALAGDVTGSVSFNGSSNVTITATVADDSHNHTISNIDGLQTEIDTKAELAGSSGQNFSAATLNATTVDLGDWTLTESAGTLYFASGGVNKMKLDASGNLTVTGNVNTAGVI